MSTPLTDEQLAQIKARATRVACAPDHPGSYFSMKDSAQDVPALLAEIDRLKHLWSQVAETSRQRGEEIKGRREHGLKLQAEIERLKAELKAEVEFHMDVRLEVERVLDQALGTEVADGAEGGLAADVALLAARKTAAEAEVERQRIALDGAADHIGEVLAANERLTILLAEANDRIESLDSAQLADRQRMQEAEAEVTRLRQQVGELSTYAGTPYDVDGGGVQ